MSTTETAPLGVDQAREALEAFVTDNLDLEHLETLLSRFNIFEAIGVVRHEVRHSDFLAYLLNPQENHGLGDAFFKRLLQKAFALSGRADLPVTPMEVDAWDLCGAVVQREWQHIDVFLRDEEHRFSVIIENKIDTGEHDGQLSRYYERVRLEYPDDRILALYLTRAGDEPTDDRYSPMGYEEVCEAVEHLAEGHASVLDPDVRTLMTHYAQMLRRHIMSDTEIARLCGQIYQKHKTALDLIYEHRPNRQEKLMLFLRGLLETIPTWWVGPISGKGRWLGVGIPEWPNFLYFVFDNSPAGLILWMTIGDADSNVRQRLFEFAATHQPPFRLKQKWLSAKHSRIFSRTFLTATEYAENNDKECEEKISDILQQFLRQDLPDINYALAKSGLIDQPASINQQQL